MEEITDCGDVDTATVWETLHMQQKKVSKGEHIDINKESDFNKRKKDVIEEVMPAKFSH